MIGRILGTIAVAAALMLPVGASAQVTRQFSHKEAVQLDPGTGYIFYRTMGQAPMIFIREPDEADIAAWRADRKKAFDKAMREYRTQYRKWRGAMDVWEGSSVVQRRGLVHPGDKPVMPMDDTFDYPAIETTTMAMADSGRVFLKEKPVFGYLIAVKPGTYAIYGSIELTGNGLAGVCMCMGTAKFEVRAGEIAELGMFGIHGVPAGATAPRPDPYLLPPPFEIRPFEGALPARLQGLPVHPAQFRAAGKLPNFLGVTIDRLYPISGVLAYKRDTVIDARTGQPVGTQSAQIK
jgi:hypothetical protein